VSGEVVCPRRVVSVKGEMVLVSDNGGNGVSFSVNYFDSNVR
jgi:hypothetical protein